jgi:dephospho-CoA kinase
LKPSIPSIIGLTGGIGCGKSAVGRALQSLGLRRLDTDQVARSVVGKGTPGLAAVVQAFGTCILASNGNLDRKALAEVVFGDERKRKLLESILHPRIWSEVEEFVSLCRQQDEDAVIEVPLLFENERQGLFDAVWVVASDSEVQRKRLHERNGWSDQEIEARISSQMPLEEKVERADTVLWNNGMLSELEDKVMRAWQRESS